jgi:hypothetical protein
MCFALFIASASFFLGQADEIPEPLRIPLLLAVPVLVPLLVMAAWLWRLRRRRPARGLPFVAGEPQAGRAGVSSAAHRRLVPRLVRLAVAVPLLGAAACATSTAPRAADEAPHVGNSFAVVDVRVFDGERVVPRATVVVRVGLFAAVGDAPPRAESSGRPEC